MTARPRPELPPDPEVEGGAGFCPAVVGPNWSALPLPAIILDAEGRIAAMNDLAESFLNISCRSSLGQAIEGPEMAKRLRVVPSIGTILERVREGHEALNRAGVRFEIGDRSGGHSDRFATLHAGPAPSPAMKRKSRRSLTLSVRLARAMALPETMAVPRRMGRGLNRSPRRPPMIREMACPTRKQV